MAEATKKDDDLAGTGAGPTYVYTTTNAASASATTTISTTSSTPCTSEIGVFALVENVLTRGVERLATETGASKYFVHLDTRIFLRRLAGSLLPRSADARGAMDP